MEDKIYWIWLSKIEIMNKIKLELIDKFGSIKKIYEANFDDLLYYNFSDSVIDKITDLKKRKNLKQEYEFMKKNNINIINFTDKNYPQKLLNIYNFPITLYYIGNIDLINQENVAMVGARNATNYGKTISKQLSKKIADKGINIVSGLANGIDKFSHLGALESKFGKTIAVLGTGINKEVLYPMENLRVYERIIENNGLIITEYPINTKPVSYHFPARNRIISGISKKIVVVEAGLKSGSLITADFALEQGKDIYAVPRKYFFKNFRRSKQFN